MLTDAQLDQFHAEGYLIIRGLLSYENDLQPVVAEYDGIMVLPFLTSCAPLACLT